MINSIRYFEEKCINRFEELENNFIKEPQKLAEYVLELTEELHNLGLRMIQESLEDMNEMLRKSQKRLHHWVVESHETKQLITSLGTVTYKKTLFKNSSREKYLHNLEMIQERLAEIEMMIPKLEQQIKEANQKLEKVSEKESTLF